MTTTRQNDEESEKENHKNFKKAADQLVKGIDYQTGKPIKHGNSGAHHQSRQNNVKKKFSK